MKRLFITLMLTLALAAPEHADAQRVNLEQLIEKINNRAKDNNNNKNEAARKTNEQAVTAITDALVRISSRVDNHLLQKFADAAEKNIGSKSPRAEKVRVIVRAREGRKARLRSLRFFGAKVLKTFTVYNGALVEIRADRLDRLADHFDIASLSYDAPLQMAQSGTDSILGSVTGSLVAAQAYGVTGAGVGIAVVDSGIGNHADLPNVVHTVDFTGGNTGEDEFGHGTHVAGIIAGNGAASAGEHAGIAPGAHLIDLKVLSSDGSGSTSDVIEAIEWAILNKDLYNIRIINLSLGHMPYEAAETDPLSMMVRAATDAGIVAVVSAGNAGRIEGEIVYGGITSPGIEASAITVGAMTTWDTPSRADDTVGGYSSRGPTRFEELAKPDIAAPGTQIVAPMSAGNALATNYPAIVVDSNYMWLTGTSMSAPVVSGAVALMLEQNPSLNPNQVKAIMMYTAEDHSGNPYEVGAGYLNAAGAVNLAANVDATTAEGDYWLLNNGVDLDYSNVIAGFPAVWSETIVWGKGLYSVDNMDYNETSYGETIVWGKTITWEEVEGETIVWGKTIVWDEVEGETITWGKTITWEEINAETITWGKTITWDDF